MNDERPRRRSLLDRIYGPGGWWDRLNSRLVRVAGPATVGPYETTPEPVRTTRPCPLCGHAMDEHTFDRSGAKPLMFCP
jgi:hypothetical protein